MNAIRSFFASLSRLAIALDRLAGAVHGAADLVEDRTATAGAIEAPAAPTALALDNGHAEHAEAVTVGGPRRGKK